MTHQSDTTRARHETGHARRTMMGGAAEPSGGRLSPAQAILVLGMPRSGASALARLFNLLGADLPQGPAGRGNERELRSPDDLRGLNDEILASAGVSRHDWRAFNQTWYASPEAASFKRRLIDLLNRNFGRSTLFALNDPRICRIVPLWLEAFAELGMRASVVMPIRSPVEVAESLRQRDGIAPAESHLLWLRNMLDAERGSRAVPRVVATYADLLDDWYGLVETVAVRLDLSWPKPAESVRDLADRILARQLPDHASTPDQSAGQAELAEWVKNAYAVMTRMARVGGDEASLSRLDRIGDEFDRACLAFAPVTGVMDDAQTKQREVGRPTWEKQLNDKTRAAVGADVEHDPIRAELATLQVERAKHSHHVEQLNSDIAKLREDLERRDAELEMSSTELGVLRALSASRSQTVRFRERRAGRLNAAADLLLRTSAGFLNHLRLKVERNTQADAIRSSGLFDAKWYLERYPDVAKFGLDPLLHYLEFGAWEGRDPHPLFDQVWYRTTYPEILEQNQTPLGHFVTIGAANGYNPNPLFHTAWYVASQTDIGKCNPLQHYVEHAAEEGRNPNPLFDSAWYLRENPDVAAANMNPLAHYIHQGIAESRDPHPAFDAEWYMQQYEHAVVSGMDALEHYLSVGALRGYRTRPREGKGRNRAKALRRRGNITESPEDAAIGKPDLADQGEGVASEGGSSVDIYRSRMVLPRRARAAEAFTGEVGVFVHLFYEDLAQEIAASLLDIPFDSKIYISTNSREKKEAIEAAFRQFGFDPMVKVLPNRGWDIAPFLLGFSEEMRNHDICLKLHGKRSRHGYDSERGNAWRKHLLSGLLGHPRNVSLIVNSFSAHQELGVVMPPHWRGVGRQVKVIGPNYRHMRSLLKQIHVSIAPDQPIEFPSGSMFWFRRAALQPLFDLGLSWSDFARCRPRDLDATIAHGIERCVLIFAAHAGFKWALVPRRWAQQSWALRGKWGALGRGDNRSPGTANAVRAAALRK